MTEKIKQHIGFYYFVNKTTTEYFDSFRIEYITQDVLNKIKDTLVTHKLFITYSDDSIMCVLYCIAFIEYSDCRQKFARLY